jgi:hypothetical protein
MPFRSCAVLTCPNTSKNCDIPILRLNKSMLVQMSLKSDVELYMCSGHWSDTAVTEGKRKRFKSGLEMMVATSDLKVQEVGDDGEEADGGDDGEEVDGGDDGEEADGEPADAIDLDTSDRGESQRSCDAVEETVKGMDAAEDEWSSQHMEVRGGIILGNMGEFCCRTPPLMPSGPSPRPAKPSAARAPPEGR